MKRVHGIHKPVHMKSPRNHQGQRSVHCRPAHHPNPVPVTHTIPAIDTDSHNRPNPWKKTKGISHIPLLPLKLRHRNPGIHGKCYQKRLYYPHPAIPPSHFQAALFFRHPIPPLPSSPLSFTVTGIPATTSTTLSAIEASTRFTCPSARTYSVTDSS